ncbi:partial O-antigen biosynthesis protein WbqP, partial [uncultured bacterium]
MKDYLKFAIPTTTTNTNHFPEERMTPRMITTVQNGWIRNFDPKKRIFTGQAYRAAKRIMDLFIVLVSAPLWLTVFGLVAFVIKVSNWNAPVLFFQQRTGKGGKRFRMFKFRSMVPDAEKLK